MGGLPENDWPWWSGPLALLAGLVIAAVGGLIVDIPASALGVEITAKHVPHGIELADTFVQDLGFVLAAVAVGQLGGQAVRSWQLGLRPTRVWKSARLVAATFVAFLLFNVAWASALHITSKEKLLEQLGTNETTTLLVLSALLTTVVAPICEETLFRGYIFGALSKWKGWLPAAIVTGVLFGGVHAGSAPVADLVPLAALGFMLCALYRRTGSLYPCIVTHSLNNSIAFGALEGWRWHLVLALAVGALSTIGAVGVLLRGLGVISPPPPRAPIEEPVGSPS
jgi:membrane protease YdiL (CAAX protease family)